jgi:hypothetical protein
MQVLCSAHGIALNEIGEPFLITTGRQLRENGWPSGVNTLVVMLDGQRSYEQLKDTDVDIYWGAYLGMPQQLLMHGRLCDIAPDITSRRAQAREQNGWIMDIYLLRRVAPLTLGCQGASVAWRSHRITVRCASCHQGLDGLGVQLACRCQPMRTPVLPHEAARADARA